MKSTTSERLRQLMSERNLRQVDILNLSQKYQKELVFFCVLCKLNSFAV